MQNHGGNANFIGSDDRSGVKIKRENVFILWKIEHAYICSAGIDVK